MEAEDGQVFHPEMIDDDSSDRPLGLDKLDCFLDCSRVCNPSCMAYVTYPRGEPKELSDQQAHCALLLFSERLARHVSVLTGTAVAMEKRNKTVEQDRQRTESAFAPLHPFPPSSRAKP